MFDSGIRSAADIFKALALGAKYVFIGRLWIWGLSIAGEHGEYLFNNPSIEKNSMAKSSNYSLQVFVIY